MTPLTTPRLERVRLDPWLVACVALASLTAAAFLVVHPASPDLAAQAFRANLVKDHGLVLWNGQWFAGHSTLGYSLLAPVVIRALGVWATGALAIVASAVLFERLVQARYGAGGRAGALWFAVGAGSSVFAGRLTFALGVVVGLGALLAAQADRGGWRVGALAALTTLTSPVAGVFLALAGASQTLVRRRANDVIVAIAPLAAGAVVAVMFPEHGTQPFTERALRGVLVGAVIALIAVPRRHTVLRTGALLYALAATAAFVIDTPLGGNITRLGALLAGPIAACTLWPRPFLLALLFFPLLSWQWGRPLLDVRASAHDPSTQQTYYTPLLEELKDRGTPTGRLEIPTTHNHWESAYVARTVPLARGWERQIDRNVDGVFYSGTLTASRYRAWLDRVGVSWVAVPDARLEGASWPEAHLINSGLAYLRPVWHNRHWQLFAVDHPSSLVSGPARLDALGFDSFRLTASGPGRVLVRVHWQPYWALAQGRGCVYPSGDWTVVRVAAAGRIHVITDFAVNRVGAQSPRCRHSTPAGGAG